MTENNKELQSLKDHIQEINTIPELIKYVDESQTFRDKWHDTGIIANIGGAFKYAYSSSYREKRSRVLEQDKLTEEKKKEYEKCLRERILNIFSEEESPTPKKKKVKTKGEVTAEIILGVTAPATFLPYWVPRLLTDLVSSIKDKNFQKTCFNSDNIEKLYNLLDNDKEKKQFINSIRFEGISVDEEGNLKIDPKLDAKQVSNYIDIMSEMLNKKNAVGNSMLDGDTIDYINKIIDGENGLLTKLDKKITDKITDEYKSKINNIKSKIDEIQKVDPTQYIEQLSEYTKVTRDKHNEIQDGVLKLLGKMCENREETKSITNTSLIETYKLLDDEHKKVFFESEESKTFIERIFNGNNKEKEQQQQITNDIKDIFINTGEIVINENTDIKEDSKGLFDILDKANRAVESITKKGEYTDDSADKTIINKRIEKIIETGEAHTELKFDEQKKRWYRESQPLTVNEFTKLSEYLMNNNEDKEKLNDYEKQEKKQEYINNFKKNSINLTPAEYARLKIEYGTTDDMDEKYITKYAEKYNKEHNEKYNINTDNFIGDLLYFADNGDDFDGNKSMNENKEFPNDYYRNTLTDEEKNKLVSKNMSNFNTEHRNYSYVGDKGQKQDLQEIVEKRIATIKEIMEKGDMKTILENINSKTLYNITNNKDELKNNNKNRETITKQLKELEEAIEKDINNIKASEEKGFDPKNDQLYKKYEQLLNYVKGLEGELKPINKKEKEKEFNKNEAVLGLKISKLQGFTSKLEQINNTATICNNFAKTKEYVDKALKPVENEQINKDQIKQLISFIDDKKVDTAAISLIDLNDLDKDAFEELYSYVTKPGNEVEPTVKDKIIQHIVDDKGGDFSKYNDKDKEEFIKMVCERSPYQTSEVTNKQIAEFIGETERKKITDAFISDEQYNGTTPSVNFVLTVADSLEVDNKIKFIEGIIKKQSNLPSINEKYDSFVKNQFNKVATESLNDKDRIGFIEGFKDSTDEKTKVEYSKFINNVANNIIEEKFFVPIDQINLINKLLNNNKLEKNNYEDLEQLRSAIAEAILDLVEEGKGIDGIKREDLGKLKTELEGYILDKQKSKVEKKEDKQQRIKAQQQNVQHQHRKQQLNQNNIVFDKKKLQENQRKVDLNSGNINTEELNNQQNQYYNQDQNQNYYQQPQQNYYNGRGNNTISFYLNGLPVRVNCNGQQLVINTQTPQYNFNQFKASGQLFDNEKYSRLQKQVEELKEENEQLKQGLQKTQDDQKKLEQQLNHLQSAEITDDIKVGVITFNGNKKESKQESITI